MCNKPNTGLTLDTFLLVWGDKQVCGEGNKRITPSMGVLLARPTAIWA
jgi:hypothetical protein